MADSISEGLQRVVAELTKAAFKVEQTAIDIVEEAVLEAEELMRAYLDAAHTDTGRARAAAGKGVPGRVETGAMRDAIRSHFTLPKEGRGLKGEWGWVFKVAEYFAFQEYGAKQFNVSFAEMGALQQSFVDAREKMIERLRAAGFEVN